MSSEYPNAKPLANSIGWAIGMMKSGQRVRRTGWNGNGLWLAYVAGNDWGCAIGKHPMDEADPKAIVQPSLPFIVMRTVSGQLVPWLCSQTDFLASDWELV